MWDFIIEDFSKAAELLEYIRLIVLATKTDYKNAALAALKGNWGKAVLATVIYMAIMYIAMGPYVYNTVKLQNYVRESLPQVSTSVSFSTAIRQSCTFSAEAPFRRR